MKTYWGSGGIIPRILNVCTTRRWVVNFTLWLLFCRGESVRKIRGSQWVSVCGGEAKNSRHCPFRELNPCCPGCSIVSILTVLARHAQNVECFFNLYLRKSVYDLQNSSIILQFFSLHVIYTCNGMMKGKTMSEIKLFSQCFDFLTTTFLIRPKDFPFRTSGMTVTTSHKIHLNAD